jgi:hypothetical protein
MYTFKYDSTSDYSKFEKIEEYNRDTKNPQINKLEISVKDINLLPANPIIVANGFIIDGQHRYEVSKKLGLPVYYVEIGNMDINDMLKAMHKLNSNAKNWGLKDYLKLYKRQNNQNYIFLEEFMSSYSLSISQSIYVLKKFNDNVYKNTDLAGFKDGNFFPEDKDNALNKARMYKSFKDTVDANSKDASKIVKQASFIKAFFKLVANQELNIEELKDNLRLDFKSSNKKFVKSGSAPAYHDILVKIYNSRCKPELKLKTWEEMGFDDIELEEEEVTS